MNKLVFFSLLSILFFGCSDYQKVLKDEEIAPKYKMAEDLYKEKKYKKALRLFEQIVPQYRGKPQAERVMYYYADTYYQLRDYYLAGYQFERFAKSYPQSDKAEEAAYKSARSYYEISPRYTLDQSDTDKAIEKLQAYINKYPDSERLAIANELVLELRTKKEKKAFEIAKGYHHREDYKVAIKAFDNYLVDYPGSKFKENVLYFKLESEYLLAIGSYEVLVKDRLLKALEYYKNYRKYYDEKGAFYERAKEIEEDINNRLEQFN